MAIPPNKPVIRKDENDLVYRTIEAKYQAVADDVQERHAAGQPCLVGTVSVESSEKLSRLLDKRGIPHETLNAKNHEREAHIVAQAGRLGRCDHRDEHGWPRYRHFARRQPRGARRRRAAPARL